jgi:CRP/FNR family cyclic AMP-dependent transcriptional regulator
MLLDDHFLQKFGVEYAPGDIIFCEYEPGTEFYFIHSGSVKLVKLINNREKTIDVLHVGEVFGEMAILEAEPRSATAIADERTKLLKFHRDNFDALLKGNPQLAYKLLILFSRRIYDAKRRLMILLINEPDLKVMDVLVMLTEHNPNLDLHSLVTLETNAADISSWCGLTIDETQNALTHMANRGKIELYADKITVKNILDFQRQVNSRRKQMFS